jgi:hypothetical protein
MEKHHEHKPFLPLILAVIVAINLILTLSLLCKKDGAYQLETIKAGGPENMALVKQLYMSDAYKSQQKMAIESVLSQISNAGNQQVNPVVDANQVDATAPDAAAEIPTTDTQVQ